MRQNRAIHQYLRAVMRKRGLKLTDAAEVLSLSVSSVKRLFAEQSLSLARLEMLADWLGMDLSELVVASETAHSLVTELTLEQEQRLKQDPILLMVAVMVLNRWTIEDIVETYSIDLPGLTRHLIELERMGLIELFPNRIKRRTARNFSWRRNGPMEKLFRQQILPEFLSAEHRDQGEKRHFSGAMLSRKSILIMHDRIERLAHDMDQLANEDASLDLEEKHGVSLFAMFRPWESTLFTGFRRKPRTKFYLDQG